MTSNGKKTLYEILGVSSRASPEEILAAYRVALAQHERDVSANPF